ncbi:MAG: DNA-directed RNA polymerase subunit omega [Lachnospiraceae bacterium]|mgnify:FL=1|nr:DNA-directed RNA polymerase subunit omega [Lachnospiraceae bacterium]
MLHPSYADLIKVVNSEVEEGEDPVVSSRYSIVMATSKRARQIIAGDDELVDGRGKKPLSVAVEELNQGKIKILNEELEQTDEAAAEGETVSEAEQ